MKRKRDIVLRPSRGERYGRPQGGMKGDARGKAGRRLTMKDALSYVGEVKEAFQDQLENYDKFLEIMKDFETQRIDRARVIARAQELFRGHSRSIPGFNTFLPEGCEIALNEPRVKKKKPVSYEEAIDFVHKIKERFRGQEHVYLCFGNTIQMYRRRRELNAIYNEVARLFAGHPDLLEAFKRFLPENFWHQEEPSSTSTLTSSRMQMVRMVDSQGEDELDKDCTGSYRNEDMMKKVLKDDRNATGSHMS